MTVSAKRGDAECAEESAEFSVGAMGARKRSPKFFSAKSSALFAPRRFDFVPWPITTARAQAESTK